MVTTGFFRGERFVPSEEIPDLGGQVYIVTGGTKGIGYGIVTHLLKHNAARIIMLSSNEDAAEEEEEEIQGLKHDGDTSRVTWQKEVDKVSKELRESEPRIDSLILNAGIGVAPYSMSEDGIEDHFQINALSQLHMALILLPTLRKTSTITDRPSRMIMMSSEMHRFAPWSTKFESLQEINKNVSSTLLYGRSKLAQILLIREMVRRINEGQLGYDVTGDAVKKEVLINTTHPGGVRTPQQDQLVPAYGWFGWLLMWIIRPLMVDPVEVGCLSALFASTPTAGLLKDGGLHGQYIVPDKQVSKPSGKGRNGVMGKRLWLITIALLRDKIGTLDYAFELVN